MASYVRVGRRIIVHRTGGYRMTRCGQRWTETCEEQEASLAPKCRRCFPPAK